MIDLLTSIPPVWVVVVVGLVVGVESLGVPLPGEAVLIAATLLATQGVVAPWWVALSAAVGAVVLPVEVSEAVLEAAPCKLLEWQSTKRAP